MKIAIIGGGLTGMSAAYELAKAGHQCALYERDDLLGGLAGSFRVDGVYLEKFYHHLFTSDTAAVKLIEDLGLGGDLVWNPTVTSTYYAGQIFRLATPMDVLRFKPLSLINRFRLGSLAIIPRLVRDWRKLEEITAKDWLIKWGGKQVYDIVWYPLIRNKFGPFADQVAAVWFWNKLKLRGGSRGKGQAENLGYLVGGFGRAVEAFEARLRSLGVDVRLASPVSRVETEGGKATAVVAGGQREPYDFVLVTAAPEVLLNIAPSLPEDYRQQLGKIKYLANACLIMKLNRSLSTTYWLNVNDPNIPFVAVVEHTNMQRPAEYGGHHLAYLSRYMDAADPYYSMSTEELFQAYLPHLKKMYLGFSPDWVQELYSWREKYTQPVVGLHYSQIRPPFQTPIDGLWLCCMAQIYPEDRGMNYAVAYGQKVAAEILAAHPARQP
jgi:protoporphyrinogen oxidase